MKFSVVIAGPANEDHAIGTIEVDEEVYLDDDALLDCLAAAGYLDRSEVLDVTEEDENRVDIFEYDTGAHRVSLVLIH